VNAAHIGTYGCLNQPFSAADSSTERCKGGWNSRHGHFNRPPLPGPDGSRPPSPDGLPVEPSLRGEGSTEVKRRLCEQGNDAVTIKTNEGLMKRTNIAQRVEADSVLVNFDESYEAGSKATATTHFSEEFTTADTGVTCRLVMSDVEASGFLSFFDQRFDSSKTGNAFLTAYRAHFEK
jgi:hypothetical protein